MRFSSLVCSDNYEYRDFSGNGVEEIKAEYTFICMSACHQRCMRGKLGRFVSKSDYCGYEMEIMRAVYNHNLSCLLPTTVECDKEAYSKEEELKAKLIMRFFTADNLIKSKELKEKREGIAMLEINAKHDTDSMLSLALMYEFGLNGINENKDHARKIYERCEKLGSQEGSIRLATLNAEKNDRTLNMFMHRLRHNTMICVNLSGM